MENLSKRKSSQNPIFTGLQPLAYTGEEGLEPPSTVLETAALPLNYSPSHFSMLDYIITGSRKCQCKSFKNFACFSANWIKFTCPIKLSQRPYWLPRLFSFHLFQLFRQRLDPVDGRIHLALGIRNFRLDGPVHKEIVKENIGELEESAHV